VQEKCDCKQAGNEGIANKRREHSHQHEGAHHERYHDKEWLVRANRGKRRGKVPAFTPNPGKLKQSDAV